jgi:hypothetical protein
MGLLMLWSDVGGGRRKVEGGKRGFRNFTRSLIAGTMFTRNGRTTTTFPGNPPSTREATGARTCGIKLAAADDQPCGTVSGQEKSHYPETQNLRS